MGVYDSFLGRGQQQQGPPPRQPAIGPNGMLSRGFARQAYKTEQNQAGTSIAQEAQRRFQAIGTPEALQMAQMIGSNPQAAGSIAQQAGGWSKLAQGMQAQAQEGRQNQLVSQALQQGGSADEVANRLLQSGVDPALAMKVGAQVQKMNDPGSLIKGYGPQGNPGFFDRQGNRVDGVTPDFGGEMIEVVGADGQRVRVSKGGGRGGQGSNATDLVKKSITDIQGEVIDLNASRSRLGYIMDSYDEDFLTFQGRMKGFGLELADKAGWDAVVDENSDFYDGLVTFRQDTFDFINEEVNRLTGAAMGEKEAVRIIGALPNPKMGPRQFRKALERRIYKVDNLIRRHHYMLAKNKINDGFRYLKKGENGKMQGQESPISETGWNMMVDNRADAIAREMKAAGSELSGDELTKESYLQANEEMEKQDFSRWE